MTATGKPADSSRRQFLKTSAATVAAGTLAGSLTVPAVHAAGSDALKYALIGCGGRGSGAALNAMRADPSNKLTVLCDIFPDVLERGYRVLEQQLRPQSQFAVTKENCFSGFDGYKQVMASDCDVVMLCTTPHFRPLHLRAAVEAGKQIFCEKPVAVDGPGVRSCLESAKLAAEKNLNLVSGLCWRYDYGVKATMDQIKSGAIGDIIAIQENYLTGFLWHRGRKPEWSEMEYQIRNWMYFTWLSGDHNVEQHIHSLDKALWLNDDQPPALCYGLGGRQARTSEEWGNIYDHHAVVYQWPSGINCFAFTRQMGECFNETEDFVWGTKGKAEVLKHEVTSEGKTWRYKGDKPSMYDVEHVALYDAIKSGKTINNGTYQAYSTMLAIMGRMATYTGQKITWDMAINSQENLSPEKYEWGDVKVPTVAVPGQTRFV